MLPPAASVQTQPRRATPHLQRQPPKKFAQQRLERNGASGKVPFAVKDGEITVSPYKEPLSILFARQPPGDFNEEPWFVFFDANKVFFPSLGT